ncbi:hypothetical protein RBU60_10725 [Mesonia sp. MT50]|uniref:Uncharacterized protein n=1 Tax=Mesonia profundi TaxID=3070998 RepID=A0ABU1A2W8_9FLAO|nr:hypothetical protein [Mesonia profundi]MDQ7918052.1 hypothetical protein [Mesonia profundi]
MKGLKISSGNAAGKKINKNIISKEKGQKDQIRNELITVTILVKIITIKLIKIDLLLL